MTPDISELDDDYEPKDDSRVTINGRLPGEGDGVSYWTKDEDGNLVPADDEAISVEEAGIGGVSEQIGGRTEITDHGAWTWFPRRGVRHVGDHDKTYLSWMGPEGDAIVGSINHDTGTVNQTELRTFSIDDHMPPGIEVLPDGTVFVAYNARGNDADEMYYRTSNSSEDITDLSNEQTLTDDSRHNYPNPFYIESEGRLYLIYRGSSHQLRYYYSDDGGSTWSASNDIITGTQTYWQANASNGKIHFAVTDRSSSETNEYGAADIYHCYFEGGTVYTSDGSAIGSTAELSDITQIYDSSATGRQSWCWSVAGHDGNPEIAYTTWEVGEWDHSYRWAKWDGNEWVDKSLIEGGGPMTTGVWNQRGYAGGVYLDPEEPGAVFASVVDGRSANIMRLKTPDGGDTWQKTEWSDSVTKNVRPYVPENRHPDMQVFWMKGQYHIYDTGTTDSQPQWTTSIVGGRDATPSATSSRTLSAFRGTISDPLDVPSDDSTNIEMDDLLFDIKDESEGTGGFFRPKQGGIYYVDITASFEEVSAAGSFSLQVDGGADDWVSAESGDEPVLSGSGVIRRDGREDAGDPSVTFFGQVHQDTGETQTLKPGFQNTTMSVIQLR